MITQAENPVQTEVVRGWGKEFVGHWMSNWFHIPFTIPAILEGDRPKLENVYVFYKTDGAVINAVHVWDGPNKVREFPIDPPVEGDHSVSIDESNTWEINPPHEMAFGLGISILVTNKYYKEGAAQGGDVTNPYMKSAANKGSFVKEAASVLFTAAGADLQVPGSQIPSGTDTLLPNLNLLRGQSRTSSNGMYELEFNAYGDLELRNTSDGSVIFHTNTAVPSGIDAHCRMEGDGNFVVWRQGMGNIWESETWGHTGAFLRVEDDGRVAIIDPVNRIWHRPE